MSARSLSSALYLPSVSDDTFLKDEAFLRKVAELLEGIRTESELRGHTMLASLLEIAKGEAEDGLSTREKDREVRTEKSEDDGAAMMAQKFAHRADRTA